MNNKGITYIISIILCLLITNTVFGQRNINGTVKNDKGEGIPFASITWGDKNAGTQTDSIGNFHLEGAVPQEKRVLLVTAIGYRPLKKEIIFSDTLAHLDIILLLDTRTLNEVRISAGFEASDKSKGASLTPIDAVTVAGSNADITQALRSLPGSQQIGDMEGLFVRGGTGDETKQFIDGTLFKNPNYPSVPGVPQYARVNPFLFKGILFSSGGYSALYGQAMSGALIMESVDLPEKSSAVFSLFPANIGGGFQHLAANNLSSYGINLNYSNQSFYHWVVPQKPNYFSGPQYLEGDANFRIKTGKTGMLKFYANWSLSDVGMRNPDIDSTTLLSSYQTKGKSAYGNLSYRGLINDNWKLDLGTTYSYSNNHILQKLENSNGQQLWLSNQPFDHKNNNSLISSSFAQIRALLTRTFGNNQTLRFGAEHFYTHDEGNVNSSPLILNDHLTAAFAEGDIHLADDLAGRVGLRVEYSSLLHKAAFAPRLSLAYRLKDGGQFNLAYGIFYQEPSNEALYQAGGLNFSKATHYVLNYTKKANNRFFRIEAYYKQYNNLIKTIPSINNDGKGYAKGIELFFRDKKSIKNLDYWVTYTYLDTKRNFLDYPDEIRPSFAAPHTATLAIKKFFTDISTSVNVSYAFAAGRPYYDIRYNPLIGNSQLYDQGTTKTYSILNLHVAYLTSFFKNWKHRDISGIAFGVNNLLGTNQVFGYNYSADGRNKAPITLPATRSFFIGVFMSLGINRTDDLLNNNLL